MKFETINKQPNIRIKVYFLLAKNKKYPIKVHSNKLKVKFVMWELMLSLMT